MKLWKKKFKNFPQMRKFFIVELSSRRFVRNDYKCELLFTLADCVGYLSTNVDDLLMADTKNELLPALDVLALEYTNPILRFMIVEFKVTPVTKLERV